MLNRRCALTGRLVALSIDAIDVARLSGFWAALLDGELSDPSTGPVTLRPGGDVGFEIRFRPAGQPKIGQNQMHFDLTSTSLADQQRTVTKALGLGARPVDVGQRPEEAHVVLADPEGNEFLRDRAGERVPGRLRISRRHRLGRIAGGRVLLECPLEWPFVSDQDEETAIRSPLGGPKISWGGPPLMSRQGPNRLHFELAPSADGDQAAEIRRLLARGDRPRQRPGRGPRGGSGRSGWQRLLGLGHAVGWFEPRGVMSWPGCYR